MKTYQHEKFPLPTLGRLKHELRLSRPPWWMVLGLILVVIGTIIPLVLINRARRDHSTVPRTHLILDMDKQPRRGPQSAHAWFLDGRAMRLPVPGTIARGQLKADDHFARGYRNIANTTTEPTQPEFFDELPPQLPLDSQLLARGQERFEIYCALCHGVDGLGNGPINQRAVQLQDPKWVPATNLMTQEIRDRAAGQIFQAITDGVRNMPAYASQIKPRDRWAIVAYLRDLQSHSPVAPPVKK